MKQIFTVLMCFSVSIILKAQPSLNGFVISSGGTIYANVVHAKDDKLYGMKDSGANCFIFSFDSKTSEFIKVKDVNLSDNSAPVGSLIQAKDGTLYGLTSGITNFYGGTLISFDPATLAYTVVKEFHDADGYSPSGSLMQGKDGKLFGTTNLGGKNNLGVIFSFDPVTSIYQIIKDFDAESGYGDCGGLFEAADGKLYGMTSSGGDNSGVIFSLDPTTHTYSVLKTFDFYEGYGATGTFVQASDGKLYGTKPFGTSLGHGLIFSFDPATSAYSTLKAFFSSIGPGYPGTVGTNPIGSLLLADDGKLYGITKYGGKKDKGIIFSFDPSTSIFSKDGDFDNSNDDNPWDTKLTEVASTSTNITTAVLNTDVFFEGAPLTVHYQANRFYDTANVFVAQLSDTSGTFANPVNIGSILSSSSGIISATIPDTAIFGTGYRIRVVASDSLITATDNGSDFTINKASVAIYRINAGGGEVVNSIGTFAADTFGSIESNNSNSTTTNIKGTQNQEIYQTEKYGANGRLSYAFPVKNGEYNVILHFAEIFWKKAGQRVFDVEIEGTKVLYNYDIFKKAGAFTATTETFSVTVADSILNINFSTLPENGGINEPKVSAIEVLTKGSFPVVTSYTLVNASNHLDIKTLNDGDTINLATLPSKSINIRANTYPANTGFVGFTLSGAENKTQTEKVWPYALFGDNNGTYLSWTPTVGRYNLIAVPFLNSINFSEYGTTLSANFMVIDDSDGDYPARKAVISTVKTAPAEVKVQLLKAYPNPGNNGQYTILLPKQLQGQVNYTLVSSMGATVLKGTLLLSKPMSLLHFDFLKQMNSTGIYFLKLEGKEMKGQIKLMRIK